MGDMLLSDMFVFLHMLQTVLKTGSKEPACNASSKKMQAACSTINPPTILVTAY